MARRQGVPHRDFAMPVRLRGRAQTWLEGAGRPPVVPRLTTALVLIRDEGEGTTEVFLNRRASSVDFAPDVLAFPGNAVEDIDADSRMAWAGPALSRWSELTGCSEQRTRALICGAVRVLFEETGILLAGICEGRMVRDLDQSPWVEERAALVARQTTLAEILQRHSLVLRTDLLRLQSHWVTPAYEPRRYDTYYFAVRVPEEQQALPGRSGEVTRNWVPAQQALAQVRGGHEVALPPTQVMLEQVNAAGGAEAFMTHPITVATVEPQPVSHSGQLWMRAPIDSDGHVVPSPGGDNPSGDS